MSLLFFYTTLVHTMRLKAVVKTLSQKPRFGAKVPPSVNQNGVKNAILGHLSNENNTPELALVTVKSVLEDAGVGDSMYVTVADRYHPSGVFEL